MNNRVIDRLVQLNSRVEPDMRDRINALATLRGVTVGALIEMWARPEIERVTGITPAQVQSNQQQEDKPDE
jgi:hypothetical protein